MEFQSEEFVAVTLLPVIKLATWSGDHRDVHRHGIETSKDPLCESDTIESFISGCESPVNSSAQIKESSFVLKGAHRNRRRRRRVA